MPNELTPNELGADLLRVLLAEPGNARTSLRRGCANGSCGACRVIVDGALLASCVADASLAKGRVESAEDVANDPNAMRAVAAFESERPTRCRLCVGALAVTAAWLARDGKADDAIAVDDAIATMTCVCTGRGSLRRALIAAGRDAKSSEE